MTRKHGTEVLFFILILNASWMVNLILSNMESINPIHPNSLIIKEKSSISDDLNLKAANQNIFHGQGFDVGIQIGQRYKSEILSEFTRSWQRFIRSQYTLEDVIEIVALREKTLQKIAPHIIQELRGIAQSIGFSYEKLLIITLFDEFFEAPTNDDGCTSWVSAGTANKYHEVILHKNRDYDYTAQIVIQVDELGKNKYTALVTASNPTGVAAGINEYGLAVVNNLISTTDIEVSGIGNLHMNRRILEECKTVEDVFVLIDQTKLNSGVIFLVADPNKGAVIEVKASGHSTIEQSLVVDDVMYRANHFMFLNGSGSEATTSSIRRYNAAKDFLETRKGNLTLLDYFELSRHHYLEDNQPVSNFNRPDGSISNYHTLFGASFLISPTYCHELSSMWVAMNHPCSSIYVPVHIDASTLNSYLGESTAYDNAKLVFQHNLGPWAGPSDGFLDIERKFVEDERTMQISLKGLLDANDYSTLDSTLIKFDTLSTNVVKEEMDRLLTQNYWIDGFASQEGIGSIKQLNIHNRNISLVPSASEGEITSVAISSEDWSNAVVYADFEIPLNTTIEFKILDANQHVLISLSAEQMRTGYSLSSISNAEIYLYARLSTINISISPILDAWKIIGLGGNRDIGTYWENIPYYYWYGGAAVIIVTMCSCCCCYKKRRRHTKPIS